MTSEQLESERCESQQVNEQRTLPIDWTESEWFAVWLRLARGEYKPEAEPVTAP